MTTLISGKPLPPHISLGSEVMGCTCLWGLLPINHQWSRYPGTSGNSWSITWCLSTNPWTTCHQYIIHSQHTLHSETSDQGTPQRHQYIIHSQHTLHRQTSDQGTPQRHQYIIHSQHTLHSETSDQGTPQRHQYIIEWDSIPYTGKPLIRGHLSAIVHHPQPAYPTQWNLWSRDTPHRSCPLIWDVPSWETSPHGRRPLMGDVPSSQRYLHVKW